MEATDILMSEHRVIERVIAAIEKAVKRMEAGEEAQPEFFIEAANFIKGFADGCHHKKEENVLFKSLLANGLPQQGGPVQVMLVDHENGRKYTQAMRAAAERWKAGDVSAKQEAAANALSYTVLLRQHIYKEDNILFPMAGRVIPQEAQTQVTEDFEHIEHEETGEGVHEKYLALADQLESMAR